MTATSRRPDGVPIRVAVAGVVPAAGVPVYAPHPYGEGRVFVGRVSSDGTFDVDDHGLSQAAVAVLKPGGSHRLVAVPLVGGRVACLTIVKK